MQVLAYVFLALLVYGLRQRRTRQALQREGEPLEVGGQVKTLTPTGRRILQLFEVILVIRYENGRRSFPSNQVIPTRALRLLGFTPDIYLCWKSHQ